MLGHGPKVRFTRVTTYFAWIPPLFRRRCRDHGVARHVARRDGVREVPRPMDVGAANLAVDVLYGCAVIRNSSGVQVNT